MRCRLILTFTGVVLQALHAEFLAQVVAVGLVTTRPSNQRKADGARPAAESGLHLSRFGVGGGSTVTAMTTRCRRIASSRSDLPQSLILDAVSALDRVGRQIGGADSADRDGYFKARRFFKARDIVAGTEAEITSVRLLLYKCH